MDDRLVITIRRHGLTDDNEQRAYIGWKDVPLNETGKTEAKKLAKQLTVKAELVCSSPLLRCIETAQIFYPMKEIVEMDEFKELYFGFYEGQTYEQLKGRTDYRRWIASPFKRKPLGGESFEQFTKRLEKGWQRLGQLIEQKDVRHVTLFTHGGVLRYLLTCYAPLEQKRDYFTWDIPYSSGYQLYWSWQRFVAGKRSETLIPLDISKYKS